MTNDAHHHRRSFGGLTLLALVSCTEPGTGDPSGSTAGDSGSSTAAQSTTTAATSETTTTSVASGSGGSTGGSDTTTSLDGGSESSSGGSTTAGDAGPPGYEECTIESCFTEECAYEGDLAACCIEGHGTCARICDGDVSLCPPVEGYQVGCNPLGGFGVWDGHCFIRCNDGACPEGMTCAELNFGPFCTWS